MFKHCLYRLLLLFQQIAVSAEHEDSQVGYLGDCVQGLSKVMRDRSQPWMGEHRVAAPCR